MKLNNTPADAVSFGESKKVKSTIADENLGLALNMVSKNLYSNPLGSFIREIASNAVDANVDVDSTSPVLIDIYKEDDIEFIEFKDSGTGMNPDTFENIYMSWFNSNKRADNTKIGGWGLGSKSPLAYQNSFEIITRVDGWVYHYVLSNDGIEPTSELIGKSPTNEPNGTTIRVEIQDGDSYAVHKECQNQLAYFNTVYVRNETYFYDNDFKIYEGEGFKIRNSNSPFDKEMHIVLGQVVYPINFSTLGLSPIRIPVGLNFEVGELEVTLSREEINYTEKVKKTVLRRIEKVKDLLLAKYKEQLKVSDFFDYITLLKNKNKPPLQIKDVAIPMGRSKASLEFMPYEDIVVSASDIFSVFSIYNVTVIKEGKNFAQTINSMYYYDDLYNNTDKCYYGEGGISHWDSKYIANGYIFSRGKITKKRFYALARALNLVLEVEEFNEYGRQVKTISHILPGAAVKIKKFITYLDTYIKSKLKTYEKAAPLEWIEECKREIEIKKEYSKGEITHYSLNNKRSKSNFKSLLDTYKVIFYISRNEYKKKILAYSMLYSLGNQDFKNKTIFLIVSNTNVKQMSKSPQVHHIENIFKLNGYRNVLRRLYLSKIVKELPSSKIFYYSKYYKDMYTKLKDTYTLDYKEKHYNIPVDSKNKEDFLIDLCEYFKEAIELTVLTKNRKVLQYEEYIPIIKDVLKKGEIVNYLDNAPHHIIVPLLKQTKLLKLDSKFYDKNYFKKLEKAKLEKEIEAKKQKLELITINN